MLKRSLMRHVIFGFLSKPVAINLLTFALYSLTITIVCDKSKLNDI